ncbi:MAG: hypothetical protein IT288_14830 [Bdellovibrionales bacterium]|nr:hypothetical protein [Bdellovibrionales bacterium]
MNQSFKITLFVTAWVVLQSCTTPSLRVSSVPEGATVTVVAAGREPVKLGKTPLEINSKDQPQLFSDSAQVQVTQEGFMPQTALIPRLGFSGVGGRLRFNLQASELPKSCQSQLGTLDDLARGVAEVSGMLQRKRFNEALMSLQMLTSKYDQVSVLYDLQGNAYYLQKDLAKALESYRRSASIAPNNPQTQRMIERLKQLQGLPPGGG